MDKLGTIFASLITVVSFGGVIAISVLHMQDADKKAKAEVARLNKTCPPSKWERETKECKYLSAVRQQR